VAMYSESTEEYLKALCNLGAGLDPVAVGDLAERLGVSTVSIHEMIKRLAGQELVSYQPYKGISLTPLGGEVASRVVRRHRLWERFLHDVLKLPWSMIHEEAGRLEHAASAQVIEKLAEFLDNPESCPHGYPIPPSEEEECPCESPAAERRLSDLRAGDRSVIACVPEEDAELLSYMDQLGLRPQTPLEIIDVAPYEGPVTIQIRGQRQIVGHKVASQIVVKAG
jgi:DtxR family transcriptional regulator, Mn-dependent transcriptional regulator